MRYALLLGLLFAGCAAPVRPQPIYPTYDEVAWRQYCQDLRARGYMDTPNGDCRRVYDNEMARQQTYDAQAQDYNAAVERRSRVRDALRGVNLSGSNSKHTSCTSNQYGRTVYTDCD
jgi:hypothetical protein